MDEYLNLIIPVVATALFILIFKRVWRNRYFDVTVITLDKRWVRKCFEKYAMDMVYDEYSEKGKPVITKKGDYRVNYMNDVNKKRLEIIHDCCRGNLFNKDFCDFTQSEYPDARVKDFYGIICEFKRYKDVCMQQKLTTFLSEISPITPGEFFEIRKMQSGDIVGAYIIHNETKNMYYVGQAKKLFFRINQHFTGHGNGDVYADYKYGDNFTILIVKLSNSGYYDIDLLERDLIRKYDAYSYGYNKTTGNS